MRWFYGWNVVGVTLLFQAVVLGPTFSSFTFLAAPWMTEFGVARGEIMLVIPAVTIGAGVFAAFAGPLLDRHSIRLLVCVGLAEYAGGLALLGFATRFWQVLLIYAVLIAQAMVLAGSLAAQTLAAKWFRERRGLAMGVVSVGASIAGVAFPPLVTFLIAEVGWRSALLILAPLPVIVVAPLVWMVVRSSPAEKGVEPEPEAAGVAPPVRPPWTTKAILASSEFWIPIAVFFPALTAVAGVNFNLGPYTADAQIDARNASLLISAIAVTGVGGKVFFGALADRVEHRLLVAIAIAVLVFALVLLMGKPWYPRMILASMLLGFAGGSFVPLVGAVLASRFGAAAFGRVMGIAMAFLTLAFLGAPLAGWLRDRSGDYETAFRFLLTATVLGSVVLIRLRPPLPRVPESASRVEA